MTEANNWDEKQKSLYKRLVKWYPEHKVYALGAIDDHLREELSKYAEAQGRSVEQLLTDMGFENISGQAVYELRHPQLTQPGHEPEVFKQKIENILSKLDEYYPDRKIIRSVQSDHKALAARITGAYQWLGYASIKEFLTAYGYDCSGISVGRKQSVDSKAIIAELQRRYPEGTEFTSADKLFEANPDLAGNKKTISNTSKKVFGMPLGAYLKTIGLIKTKENKAKLAPKETKEQKWQRLWDETTRELLSRYEGKKLPDTFTELKNENGDVNVSRLRDLSSKLFGTDKSVLDVLRGIGLISANNLSLKQIEEIFKILRARRWEQLCCSEEELEQKNPDLPVELAIQLLTKYNIHSDKMYLLRSVLFPEKLVYKIEEIEARKKGLNKAKGKPVNIPEGLLWALEHDDDTIFGVKVYCDKEKTEEAVKFFYECFDQRWEEANHKVAEEHYKDEDEDDDYSLYPVHTTTDQDGFCIWVTGLAIEYTWGSFYDIDYGPEAFEQSLTDLKSRYPEIEYEGYIAFAASDENSGETYEWSVSSDKKKKRGGYKTLDFIGKALSERITNGCLMESLIEQLEYSEDHKGVVEFLYAHSQWIKKDTLDHAVNSIIDSMNQDWLSDDKEELIQLVQSYEAGREALNETDASVEPEPPDDKWLYNYYGAVVYLSWKSEELGVNTGDETKMFETVMEAAENGDSEAKIIAARYILVADIKNERTRAIKWINETAKEGYEEAQEMQASCPELFGTSSIENDLESESPLTADYSDFVDEVTNGTSFEEVTINDTSLASGKMFEDHEFVQVVFKGYKYEIKKLISHLRDTGIRREDPIIVNKDICQIKTWPGNKAQETIRMFPALKVAALSEYWGRGSVNWERSMVYAWYSSSGCSGFDKHEEAGFFDGAHEDGDGRWAWEHDIFERLETQFDYTKTDDFIDVYYSYPFLDEWNDNEQCVEINRRFYKEKTESEDNAKATESVDHYYAAGKDVSNEITFRFEALSDAPKVVQALYDEVKNADWSQVGYSLEEKNRCLEQMDEHFEDIHDEIEDIEDEWIVYDWILFSPQELIVIMKEILVNTAKAVPDSSFEITIENSSTYDNALVEANYTEGILTYKTRYWTCDYDDEPDYKDTEEEIRILAASKTESGIEGKTFVVTGDVHHFKNRNELKELILSLGGKLAGSVSSKTSYLITNDKSTGTSKLVKARELGVPIISEDEFLAMIDK